MMEQLLHFRSFPGCNVKPLDQYAMLIFEENQYNVAAIDIEKNDLLKGIYLMSPWNCFTFWKLQYRYKVFVVNAAYSIKPVVK